MINPLPPHSTRALRALAERGPLARSEIVTATGMTNERVHDALRSLKYRNLAGSQRTRSVYVWHLTPRGIRCLERMERAKELAA